jgi:hypothetical protein
VGAGHSQADDQKSGGDGGEQSLAPRRGFGTKHEILQS